MWALWALPVWGEEPTGAIHVTVMDADQELLVPAVRVRVGAVEVVADEFGSALFPALPEGRYDASAAGDGDRGAVVTGVPVEAHRVTLVTLCLPAGTGAPTPFDRQAPRPPGALGPPFCGTPCHRRDCTPAEVEQYERRWRDTLRLWPRHQRAKDGTRP